MNISVIVGTRPEIIKMAPIIKKLKQKKMDYNITHTGQHYDKILSEIFFKDLDLPKAGYFLDVGSGSQAHQTAMAMTRLEKNFLETKPDIALVEGDTNTVLAGALAAAKLGIKVGHVEAGLRSYDKRMPEEHNRRITDHVSTLLFAPTSFNATTLKNENVWGEVFVTGNTVIDACLAYTPIAQKRSKILDHVDFDEFVLVTAHRAENVDDKTVLNNFVEIFTQCPIPIVYPIHPRTINRLKEFGLYKKLTSNKNVKLLEPVGYFDFLVLMKNCKFILTDSGGIQEEATAPNLRKKVFVLRKSTERPEAVKAGYAKVIGTNSKIALKEINRYVENPKVPHGKCPFGDGKASSIITKILQNLN